MTILNNANVEVVDRNHKYYGFQGTVVGVNFGPVSITYTVEIVLSFRTALEDFEEHQLSVDSGDGKGLFKKGDRVVVTGKNRTNVGLAGVVEKTVENDDVVFVKIDDSPETIWYFEKVLVKEA